MEELEPCWGRLREASPKGINPQLSDGLHGVTSMKKACPLSKACASDEPGSSHHLTQLYEVQVATDTRLWLFRALQDVRSALADLIKAAVSRAGMVLCLSKL